MAPRAPLPLNVQRLILSFLPRTVTRGPRGVARYSSTVSLAADSSSRDPTESATATRFFAQSRHATLSEHHQAQSVFESDTAEYDRVPLSKLDYPAKVTPRTPDDSLLSLLTAGSRSEALKLLKELRASGQTIQPRYAFAREAERALFDQDQAEGATDAEWLEWWRLAPAVTDPVHSEVHNIRTEDAQMARRAARIAGRLLRTSGMTDGGPEYGVVEQFAFTLCQQGHARVVAEHVLVRLATYAPRSVFDHLWSAALARHAAEHRSSFRVQGSYLSARTRRVRSAEVRVSQAERDRRAAHRVQSRSESTLLWYLNRQHEAYRSLLRARGRAVLAFASTGRHDSAVELVEQGYDTAPNVPIKVANPVYLSLLQQLAAANAYPLFGRVLTVLQVHEKRLVRAPAAQRSTSRAPYFVRAIAAFSHEPEPTAVEAFSTFRYQHVVSTIEEGALFEAAEEGNPSVEPVTADRAGTRAGRRRSRQLVALLDSETGEFVEATHLVGRVLLGGPLPSANALATYLDRARIEATSSARAATALEMLSHQAQKRTERRAWWAVAEMLSAVKRGRYREAMLAYKRVFAIAALPKSMQRAVWLATRRTPVSGRLSKGKDEDEPDLLLVPNPYAVSVLVQAVVPHLRDVAEKDERDVRPDALDHASGLIDRIYAELVDQDGLELWAPANRVNESDSPSDTSSSLDSHTFVVFMRDRLAAGVPAANVLQILADMSRLGLRPIGPHYALALHALARHGTKLQPGAPIEAQRAAAADLLFVLAQLEGGSTATPRQPQTSARGARSSVEYGANHSHGRVSQSVLSLVKEVSFASSEPLSVHAYTGTLRGLRERGLSAVAGEIVSRLVETRSGGEVTRWLEEDDKFRHEVASLKREGCL